MESPESSSEAFEFRDCVTRFADAYRWLELPCKQTWEKWFCRPHFLQVCPYAGQAPRLWLPPQYRQRRLVFLTLRCLWFPAFLVLITLISSDPVADGFLISWRRILVVSPLLPISMARERVSFFSCNNFFRIDSSLIPKTRRSLMSESSRQLQKLHGCASFRNAVTYWSTLSFSSWFRLLKINLSYLRLFRRYRIIWTFSWLC